MAKNRSSSAASSSGAVRFAPCPCPSSTRFSEFGMASACASTDRFAQSGLSLPTRSSAGASTAPKRVEAVCHLGSQLPRECRHDPAARLPQRRAGEEVDRLVVVAADLPQELARDGVGLALLDQSLSQRSMRSAVGEPAAHGGLVQREPRQVQLERRAGRHQAAVRMAEQHRVLARVPDDGATSRNSRSSAYSSASVESPRPRRSIAITVKRLARCGARGRSSSAPSRHRGPSRAAAPSRSPRTRSARRPAS